MLINHKFLCVEGKFDTEKDRLICVPSRKYAQVHLCFKANMNIVFAEIKLHSKDLYVDALAVFDDAYSLGEEIAKRWNEKIKE